MCPGYEERRPRPILPSPDNNSWSQYWTTAALPGEAAYNTNVRITFKNNWNTSMGGTLGQLGSTFGDRNARGGPAIRQDPYFFASLSIRGNDRRGLVPHISVDYFIGDRGRNSQLDLSPELDCKALGKFSSALSLNWTRGISDNQWYGNFTDATGTHYAFAHLQLTTTSATLGLNYTFTPDVSLQGYVQPFVSKGTYSNVRQLSATPRAADYNDRYAPFNNISITSNPGGFNSKAFQSNVVFRWEYSPGSTLFVVWNEGRRGLDSIEGSDKRTLNHYSSRIPIRRMPFSFAPNSQCRLFADRNVSEIFRHRRDATLATRE